MNIIVLALIALPILVILELLWLNVIAKNFYKQELSSVLLPKVNRVGAIAFYTMYPLAVSYFVITPAITTQSFSNAFLTGALFGFVCYATCEFTNLAMVQGWTKRVVIVNLLWGMFTTGVSAAISFVIATSLLRM